MNKTVEVSNILNAYQLLLKTNYFSLCYAPCNIITFWKCAEKINYSDDFKKLFSRFSGTHKDETPFVIKIDGSKMSLQVFPPKHDSKWPPTKYTFFVTPNKHWTNYQDIDVYFNVFWAKTIKVKETCATNTRIIQCWNSRNGH